MVEKKTNKHIFRISDEEEEMLRYVCERTGKSMTDVFRTGIKTQYDSECIKAENEWEDYVDYDLEDLRH